METTLLFMKEIYLRFTLKSPVFFKKFRALLISVAGICASLSAAGIEMEIEGISLTKLGAFATAISAIIASMAVENPEELADKLAGPPVDETPIFNEKIEYADESEAKL